MPDILSISDVAELAGLVRETICVYRSKGTMPEPDGYLGRFPWWERDTIENWLTNRTTLSGRPRKIRPDPPTETASPAPISARPADTPGQRGQASDPATGSILLALGSAWGDIRRRHPDVPDVTMAIAFDADQRFVRPGHAAVGYWTREGGMDAQLFVADEDLRIGSRYLLGALLHMAAHGLANARETSDTSRNGRYHNTRYRTLAEELGLGCHKTASIGWSATTVSDDLASSYRATLKRLNGALAAYCRADPVSDAPVSSSNEGAVALCSCGRRISLTPFTFEQGPIYCGVCGESFKLQMDTR